MKKTSENGTVTTFYAVLKLVPVLDILDEEKKAHVCGWCVILTICAASVVHDDDNDDEDKNEDMFVGWKDDKNMKNMCDSQVYF